MTQNTKVGTIIHELYQPVAERPALPVTLCGIGLAGTPVSPTTTDACQVCRERGAIVDEHAAELVKVMDRQPTERELVEYLYERAAESHDDEPRLSSELRAVAQLLERWAWSLL